VAGQGQKITIAVIFFFAFKNKMRRKESENKVEDRRRSYFSEDQAVSETPSEQFTGKTPYGQKPKFTDKNEIHTGQAQSLNPHQNPPALPPTMFNPPPTGNYMNKHGGILQQGGIVLLKKTILTLGLILSVAGCSSGDKNESSGGDASAAETTYKQNCASCHGQNLEGANGPALKAIGKEHSKDEILEQIKNGGDGMPAALIKGKEAENVASWLADKK
jgi:cytochrome c551